MSKADDRQVDIGIGWRLRRAHMAFSRAFRHELAKVDVSFGQFVHLEKLWENDGPTQAELSRAVGIETASSTSILDELERLGLVRRIRNPKDRRKINVFLTDAGHALQPTLLERARAVNLCAKKNLRREDIEALFSLLDEITLALMKEYPQASGRADTRERLES